MIICILCRKVVIRLLIKKSMFVLSSKMKWGKGSIFMLIKRTKRIIDNMAMSS